MGGLITLATLGALKEPPRDAGDDDLQLGCQ